MTDLASLLGELSAFALATGFSPLHIGLLLLLLGETFAQQVANTAAYQEIRNQAGFRQANDHEAGLHGIKGLVVR